MGDRPGSGFLGVEGASEAVLRAQSGRLCPHPQCAYLLAPMPLPSLLPETQGQCSPLQPASGPSLRGVPNVLPEGMWLMGWPPQPTSASAPTGPEARRPSGPAHSPGGGQGDEAHPRVRLGEGGSSSPGIRMLAAWLGVRGPRQSDPYPADTCGPGCGLSSWLQALQGARQQDGRWRCGRDEAFPSTPRPGVAEQKMDAPSLPCPHLHWPCCLSFCFQVPV